MPAIYPFDLPAQQLPQPTDRLGDGFLRELPAPIGLWLPSKLAKAAADFTPLPQKHFGTLNGGITNSASNFGMLGAAWQTDGSSGSVSQSSVLGAVFGGTYAGGITFLVWCNPSSVTGFVPVFDTTHRQTSLFIGSSYFGIGGTSEAYTPSVAFTANEWQLCGISSNGLAGTGQVIRNDKIVASGLAVGRAFTDTLQFGLNPSTGGTVVPIKYGGAFLFSSQLSAAQVSDLYACLRTGEPFPLFQPQTAAMMLGSAAAPAAGGLLLRRRRAAA